MPEEAHDSWLGVLGIDVDQIRAKVQGVVKDVQTAVDQGIDNVVSGAKQLYQDAENAVTQTVQKVESAGGEVASAVKKTAQAFSPGAASGPMASDCKPVHGQVPGPAEHLLCQTHGHILDVKTGQIIAASLEEYKRLDVAHGGGKSLLQKAADLGGAAVQAVDDAGGAVVQRVKNAGAEIKQAAGDAADALGNVNVAADLKAAFNSGAPLNSPSYVNAQDPSPNLNGAAASAGDSYFVTGGQKGQLVQRAKDIKGAATAFYDLGKKLEEKGIGGTFEFKDDKLIASAKNVTGIADGLMKLANAIDSWTGAGNKESIEKGSKAVDYVSKIIDAADAILAVKKLSVSAEEMAKKPNQATIEAWADDVGNTFDKAGGLIGLIPSDGLPGFVTSYYKGLLSAPKNYITAFKTIMHARYDKLDMEAGISGSNQRANNWGTKTIEWEGDLVPLYIKAYFQPKAKDGQTLQGFMKAHQKIDGVDLYKANIATGKALLGAAIARERPDEDDPTTPSAG